MPAHQPASVHYHTDTKYFPPLHHAHTAHAKAHKMSGQGKGDVRAAEARINALMKRSDAVEGTQEKILSILHDTCEEEVEVRIAQLSDAGAMAVAPRTARMPAEPRGGAKPAKKPAAAPFG